MKKVHSVYLIIFFIIGVLLVKGNAKAEEWQFPLALSYVHGFSDVVNVYEENLEAEGFIVYDVSYMPVAVSFHPYIQFDNGFRFGAGAGPMVVILSKYASHIEAPINLNAGYSFILSSGMSLYARAGIMYHIAFGNYVEGSYPGIFGAVGMAHKFWDLGVEIGYDASEVKLKKINYTENTTENIRSIGLMISVYWFF